MTEELYLADDTVTTFEATVERALDDRVVLDQTHFYPTGGDSPTTRGRSGSRMRRWPTVTVSLTATTLIDAGGSSTSRRRTPCITPSNRQETELLGPATTRRPIPSHPSNPDSRRGRSTTRARAGPTRYHTAQHLLSALLLAEFDASTTGNQLRRPRAPRRGVRALRRRRPRADRNPAQRARG